MASANILTRLLLNTTDFDQKLGKSKKDVDSWSKQMTGMGSVVGGAMKGIAGAAGLAFGAMETFDRVIKANETNNDKWENTMRAVNNSVNEFFSAITSGDFTIFQNGLEGIIRKARDTAESLRQIEDAQAVFGLFSSENRAIFNENMVILRDKTASQEDRDTASKAMKEVLDRQNEYASSVAEKALTAVQNIIGQRGRINASDISEADIMNMLSIALDRQNSTRSEDLEARYQEYVTRRKDLINHYQYDLGYRPEVYMNSYDIKGLDNEYADAILYNQLWNKVNGDELLQLILLLKQAYSARSEIASMQRTYNRALQSSNSTGGTGIPPAEGSIAWYETEIKELRDKITSTTDEAVRIQAQKTINEYEAQIKGINTSVAAAISRESWESLPSVTSDFIPSPRIEESGAGVIAVPDDGIELPELPYQSDNIEETADALGTLGGAISNITGLVDSGAAAWADYFANIIQTVGQVIPIIDALTISKEAEAQAAGKAAATEAGSSVASIPIVGPVMAVAAIASVVAALANIPKFAEGGIVGGSSYYGDRILARLNSGEMVLNQKQQSRLLDSIERPQQNIHITGRLTASGRDLKYVFDNYDSYRQK